jgi:hypothetical protein
MPLPKFVDRKLWLGSHMGNQYETELSHDERP